ncbi:DUF4870 domain-containing protein [Sanyastnella coralliicola]|uniref:DUF4870 domain-containing protein n=1 Tax=Sanyastnella coralliicola TaxID=3069118 RepID=UPI0027BA8679|nr:DUF4870 domain-containing protein [Longitalea sp. SCSIO 12813]
MESLDQITEPPSQDEKTVALLAHIGTLIGAWIVPLVIWLVKKDESDFIARHAKESLNFQISVMIYMVVCIILAVIVIGVFLAIALGIAAFVFVILATIAASGGKDYKYPMTIRFIS